MSKQEARSRSRKVAELTALGLLVGLAAGCSSDVTRFDEPIFTGSTDNQKRIIKKDGEGRTSYDEIVTGSISPTSKKVDSEELDAKSDEKTVKVARAERSRRGERATDAHGRWSKTGGTTIVLKADEDLQTISRRYGVPLSALLRANNVRSGRVFGPGDRVVVPTYAVGGDTRRTRTAAIAPDTRSEKRRARAGVHKVRSGDTLYSIARTYDVPRSEIIRANGIDNANKIRIGMSLKIPGKTTIVASASDETSSKPRAAIRKPKIDKPRRVVRKRKKTTEVASLGDGGTSAGIRETEKKADTTATASTKKAATETAKEKAPETTASIAPLGDASSASTRTLFRWPVRGRIISRFGRLPNGQHNDGINLAVPVGTSVKAADNGTVIYAGNELKGYGNLLLISHSDGWVSAYAHNSELMVSRGDVVRRGQIIARAGSTGNVDRPQLHFELRRHSKPVNPTPFMSGA